MRRQFDFYPTPRWATDELLNSGVPIGGLILEPCAGDLAIASVLSERAGGVCTNDLNSSMPTMFHQDVCDKWEFGDTSFNWIVTNPPFNRAAQIIPICYERAIEGIAMLLRLSFLEPTEDRGAWLNAHPPTTLIVLPRISFTGDGKTDNVTCAWMIWEKGKVGTIIIAENPRFATKETSQLELVA